MTKTVKYFWRIFFAGLGFAVLFLLAISWGIFGKLPSLSELENPSILSASEVYAADGRLMGKYYVTDRTNVPYSEISPNVINALVATEDERFYRHSGIDARSLGRAVFFFGSEGGASTITQQLAKNMLGQGSRNTIARVIEKLKEMIVAIKLERNFTKEEILALYLNTVEYSDHVYGIRNASRTFFQKDASRLDVAESAVLIGMLKATGTYNPRTNPKLALDRRNTVIDQMVRNNYLPAAEAAKVKLVPIKLDYEKMNQNTNLAPYFIDVLRNDIRQWCKDHKNPKTGEAYNIYKDGLKIYTTIDPRMQLYAEMAVARHMPNLQKVFNAQKNIKDGSVWKTKDGKAVLERAIKSSERWADLSGAGLKEAEIRKSFDIKVPMKVFAWNAKRETDTIMTPLDSIKYHKQMLQASFLLTDPLTGEVKAWVGGIDFKTYKFDHVNANTKRQVGSTFKPLLYTLAVMNGYTPETPVPVDPVDLGGKMIGDKKYSGTRPLNYCLAASINPAAANLMNVIGVNRMVDFAHQCGISSTIPPYPSIALGSADISLIEMVGAYSMFPAGGMNTKPIYIARIEDRNGNVLQSFTTSHKEVINESDAYIMTRMMQGVVDFGTGRSLRGTYGIASEVAGKTGTTNSNADGWFIGFTPQLLGGAWVGADDPILRISNNYVGQGAQMAMPIWAYFFQEVYKDKTLGIDAGARFVQPESLKNEMIYDWVDPSASDTPILEGENQPGDANQYIDVPVSDGRERVTTESQLNDEEKKILEEAKNANKKKDKVQPDTADKKKKGFFRKLFGGKKKNE
ncbi:transglycosylase domain-containing protein [Agriterribacter sp.]|uniref:penicillin-binding protein 1A n=1 Tax=Agriterribacter sp. TaxID=2821509 RepID=UPI002BF6D5FD|nr:transglycosylase domain-containing protein [Agriterribacter sp.]HRO44711.1 transglycosylase domain-containing protein [Agriterribacter sp.]HRQ16384.1 transglycosylase domain-containing protein [Agriterribacter sp.]